MSELTTYNPRTSWAGRLAPLFSELDNAFSNIFPVNRTGVLFQAGKEDFKYSFDLPGVKKDDLKLTVEGGFLIVDARRRNWTVEKDSDANAYASIRQAVELPEDADPEKVDASLVDGVLYVKIAKREEAKPRSIEVKIS